MKMSGLIKIQNLVLIAAKGHHGYMIWTELTIGPLFYGLMYKNPQEG